MASTLKPGGFTGCQSLSGHGTGILSEYPIANGLATNLMPGDPVALHTDGTLVKASVSTQYVIGVLQGIKPEGQATYVPAKYFASGTSVTNSTNTIKGLVATNPLAVYEAQFDGSVSAGDVGTNFDVTAGTGDTVMGISTARVHASSRSDAAGMVKLIAISTRADNAVTDAYPFGLFHFNNTQLLTKVSVV